jgi:hypothetical protein
MKRQPTVPQSLEPPAVPHGRPIRALLLPGGGAVLGALLLATAGNVWAGWEVALFGCVVGALVGALAGKRMARHLEQARADVYWRERPYVDTGAALLEGPLDLDLTAARDGDHTRNIAPTPEGLGDVAASPGPRRIGAAGPATARRWGRQDGRDTRKPNLADLAAQGK